MSQSAGMANAALKAGLKVSVTSILSCLEIASHSIITVSGKESASCAGDTKPECTVKGAEWRRQGKRWAEAAQKDEQRPRLQWKHSPKAQRANGAWGFCPQVQMSQMCHVLDAASQVAGTGSSLWRTVGYYAASHSVAPIPHHPHESWLWHMWCCSLGKASRSSPFAPHLDCRGLEKQSYRVRRRLEWSGPVKVTPASIPSHLHSDRPGLDLSLLSQPLQPVPFNTVSFPSLARGFLKMGLNSLR